MKLTIDPETCTGHGRCYSLAPELFDVDESGSGVVALEELPPGLLDQARLAVQSCPERAIAIVDSQGR